MIRNIQAYILTTEFAPERVQISAATLVMCLDILPLPIVALYLKFIQRDWLFVGIFSISLSLFNCICTFFIPESPRFLFEKGEAAKAKNIINMMARMNGSDLADQNWRFLTKNKEKVNKGI